MDTPELSWQRVEEKPREQRKWAQWNGYRENIYPSAGRNAVIPEAKGNALMSRRASLTFQGICLFKLETETRGVVTKPLSLIGKVTREITMAEKWMTTNFVSTDNTGSGT